MKNKKKISTENFSSSVSNSRYCKINSKIQNCISFLNIHIINNHFVGIVFYVEYDFFILNRNSMNTSFLLLVYFYKYTILFNL